MGWRMLHTDEHINLHRTLMSGQVFVFRQTGDSEYTGVVAGCLVSLLQQDSRVLYRVLDGDAEHIAEKMAYFFTLDVSLGPLLADWGLDTKRRFHGLRSLRYDLVPTIFSFICSSNNNLGRITKMVGFLFSRGRFIMRYRGIDFHHFPSAEDLVGIEDELRRNGFGYRSRYICNAAAFLVGSSVPLEPGDARRRFMEVRGIGNKVADCILLIGMGCLDVVPIDTHVLRHARRHFGIGDRSLTERTYREIQGKYRAQFGRYAGIAQLYIFREMAESRR